ncbi:MAG: 16S rRNA (cytidine(1402)-2'-O)-methyltransferase [Candidatus Pacebacteria bacterium]|nr:16S rRNA (cytidine(1402)-2'-O)-methyltransferase [Candidatus Paceibacterota bacterium]
MGNLFVVATPIGNLEDVSLRTLRILKEVDLILCEDTRVTKKLLSHYNIKTPVISYHQHSQIKKMKQILLMLQEGKNLALVSDSGTPGISDPGNKLISFLIQKSDSLKDFKIIPIPGCSALLALSSVSGLPMDKFVFLGFPPNKNKRNRFFEELLYQLNNFKHPVIFYESPHRIIKTLEEVYSRVQGFDLDYQVVIGRELTKKFETIYWGTLEEMIDKIKYDRIKGEFTVIIYQSQ